MVPAEDPDLPPVRSPSNGWFASAYNANDLIRVFDTLWLKAGFALHAYDSGGSARGIIWAALAHVLRNKVEAAYRRTDLFERRRRLMEDWAAYLAGESREPEAVPIR